MTLICLGNKPNQKNKLTARECLLAHSGSIVEGGLEGVRDVRKGLW